MFEVDKYLRDAKFLMVNERPFIRWCELTGTEQLAYLKRAKRIVEHLEVYEKVK